MFMAGRKIATLIGGLHNHYNRMTIHQLVNLQFLKTFQSKLIHNESNRIFLNYFEIFTVMNTKQNVC